MPLSAEKNLRYIQILLIIIIIVIVNMRAFSTLSSIVGAGRRTAEWAGLSEEGETESLKSTFLDEISLCVLAVFILFRMHDTWYFTTWKSHESKLIKKRGERREEKKIHRKREDIKRNENVFFSTSPAMPTFSSLSLAAFFPMLCRSCSFLLLTTLIFQLLFYVVAALSAFIFFTFLPLSSTFVEYVVDVVCHYP